MSVLAELIEIVRHCDVQYLDQWYGPKADPEDIAAELHDAVRAEALREAAAVAGEFPARFPDMDAMKAAGLIGPHTMSTAIRDELCRLADEVQEKASAPAVKATPEFFQAHHTYQRGYWTFQCLAVAPAPWNGETRAVGFLSRSRGNDTGAVQGMDLTDWEHGGWTDATKGGGS